LSLEGRAGEEQKKRNTTWKKKKETSRISNSRGPVNGGVRENPHFKSEGREYIFKKRHGRKTGR